MPRIHRFQSQDLAKAGENSRASTGRPDGGKHHSASEDYQRGLPGGPLPLLIGWRLPPRDPETGRRCFPRPFHTRPPHPEVARGLRVGFLGNRCGWPVHSRSGAREGVVSAAATQG